MILKGNQRAGGMQLANHLLNMIDNDHVTVHEVSGFISNDLAGAFKEAYAISRGTRCKQFLFSLSLSPPETEDVSVAAFEKAIAVIEERLGLSGQPRAVVFHEKYGRRHAHAVWSRIDVASMTAINLPHYKLKLRDVSRQLFIQHGWAMPSGLMNSEEGNPLNFSREEWQQARRIGRDPKRIKTIFQDCWATSDGLAAFRNALEARGYYLANGRRGYVAVDWQGEVFAVSKWIGLKAKDVRAKLGDPFSLPNVDDVSARVAGLVDLKIRKHSDELRQQFAQARTGLQDKRATLVKRQRQERSELRDRQTSRHQQETLVRADRFRKGLLGLWDWMTGKRAALRRQNERELAQCAARDAREQHDLVQRQLAERRELQRQIRQLQERHEAEEAVLRHPSRSDQHVQPASDEPDRLAEKMRRKNRRQLRL